MVPVASECAVYTGRCRVWSQPRYIAVVCVRMCTYVWDESRRLTNRVGDSYNGGSPRALCSRRIRRRRHLIRRLIFSRLPYLSLSLTHCLSVSAHPRFSVSVLRPSLSYGFFFPNTRELIVNARTEDGRGSTRFVLRILRDVRTNYNNMICILSIENYAARGVNIHSGGLIRYLITWRVRIILLKYIIRERRARRSGFMLLVFFFFSVFTFLCAIIVYLAVFGVPSAARGQFS